MKISKLKYVSLAVIFFSINLLTHAMDQEAQRIMNEMQSLHNFQEKEMGGIKYKLQENNSNWDKAVDFANIAKEKNNEENFYKIMNIMDYINNEKRNIIKQMRIIEDISNITRHYQSLINASNFFGLNPPNNYPAEQDAQHLYHQYTLTYGTSQ